MGHYPFTWFNGITLIVLALAAAVAWQRFRRPLTSNWPLVHYAVIAGYSIGFSGSLNLYWVAAGVACAVAIRGGFHPSRMRLLELLPLAYVMWRCTGLLLMW